MEAILTEGITKKYKDVVALENVSLSINQGEIFALLGENGAGKTTLIKILTGQTDKDGGKFYVLGYDELSRDKYCDKINISPQETAVAKNLTVKENLIFSAMIFGLDKQRAKESADKIMQDLSLLEVQDKIARKLSGGMERRLSIGMALITNPKILFLDEPTLGLDVRARRSLWKVIGELKGKTTVILTTHYLEEAEFLADRIAILSRGKINAIGTLEQLMALSGKDNIEDVFISLTGGEL